MYEIMNPGKNRELAPVSDESYKYNVNECYQLQTCQQTNATTGADDGGSRSVGGGEVEHSMKGDSQKGMKRCLIALVFAVVLMAVVTIAAFSVAVINYSHLSGELNNKLQLNKVNSLSGQLHQLNESKEADRELTNDINLLSIQHQQLLSSTRDNISQVVVNLNTVKSDLSSLQVQRYCGAGLWYRVAFLNMIDPSQQCPSAWRLVTTNGVRACGRPASLGSSCPGTFYSATSEYQRVCGRVIGYQDMSPDGFGYQERGESINESYLDGVSITYGQPRNHIWSYVAGVSERSALHSISNCPCSNASGTEPQSFVGDNYYCESGNPANDTYSLFYSDDKLWDGKQCEGTCCTDSKSPPWFSVRLPNPTTESIEVRICGDEGTSNEDTPIEILEIFVQ